MNKASYFLFFFMLIMSCEEAEFSCRDASKVRETSIIDLDKHAFQTLIIRDDINLQLVEDTIDYFELEYDKELMNSIQYSISSGDSLIFENLYSCLNPRKIRPPNLTWHSSKTTNQIIFLSVGHLTTLSSLKNDLTIITEDISNQINLSLANNRTTIRSNTASNYYLSGTCDNLVIRQYFNEGRIEAFQCEAENIDIVHRGFNDIEVFSNGTISGAVDNPGRVFVKGSAQIDVEVTNGGQLIIDDQ